MEIRLSRWVTIYTSSLSHAKILTLDFPGSRGRISQSGTLIFRIEYSLVAQNGEKYWIKVEELTNINEYTYSKVR